MAALADELLQSRLLEVSGDVWMQDAISRHDAPLDLDRLCRW